MSDDRPVPAPATTRDVLAASAGGSDSAIEVSLDDDDPTVVPPKGRSPSAGGSRAADGSPSPPDTRRRSEPRLAEVKRPRARMTLKIPDDEVARPSGNAAMSPPGNSSNLPPPYGPASVPPPKADPPPKAERAEPYRPDPSMQVLTPMRIISIGADPATGQLGYPSPLAGAFPPPARQPTPPAPAPGPSSVVPAPPAAEDSWTPYQPTTADRAGSSAPPPIAVPRPALRASGPPPSASASRPVAPSVPPSAPRIPAATPVTQPMPAAAGSSPRVRAADSIDDIPIHADDGPTSSGAIEIEPEEVTGSRSVPAQVAAPTVASPSTGSVKSAPVAPSPSIPPTAPAAPRVAVAPAPPVPPAPVSQPQLHAMSEGATPGLPVRGQPGVSIKDLPPMRALAPTEPEALEVHFEDDEPAAGARTSESEAEVAPEDLVSVESVPAPSKGVGPVPSARDGGLAPPSSVASSPAAIGVPSSARSPAAPATPSGRGGHARPARMIVPTASPLAPPP